MNYGYVSYREEANEFWMRIIQGRGQLILDVYHTGKRPVNSGCVSYREEANEFRIRIIQGRGQ
jgi:hypothetical protein